MNIESIKPIVELVSQASGQIYAVGGAVRDEVLGLESKDLDVLITGIPYEQLIIMLQQHGKTDEVGKSFGIIKFTPAGTKEVIDVALPRTEKSIGSGHRDFEVKFSHEIPVEDDLARRDFTVNAIAKNLVTGEYTDPFNGMMHLQSRIIHPVYEDSFKDDPLRILRGIQFAARFNFKLSRQTTSSMLEHKASIALLSPERIALELAKLFGKGRADKLDFALDSVWEYVFPELTLGHDYEEKPLKNAPDNMELRFLVLMLRSFHKNNGSYTVSTVQQLSDLADRLKLSSGGFDVQRMLKLYECAVMFDPKQIDKSDFDVRKFLSYQCGGDYKFFMDVCHLWAASTDRGPAYVMVNITKRALDIGMNNKDPLTLKELVVTGEDAKQAGLEGKDIGIVLKKALDCVLFDPKLNRSDTLDVEALHFMGQNLDAETETLAGKI